MLGGDRVDRRWGCASDELTYVAAQLGRAARPEDVFGELRGSQTEQIGQVRHQYRQLALAVHPDRHGNDPLAHPAFVALQKLYATAPDQIARGRYGQQPTPPGAVIITTRRRTYTVGDLLAEGDLANVYTCLVAEGQQQSAGLLKIARDPAGQRPAAERSSGAPAPARRHSAPTLSQPTSHGCSTASSTAMPSGEERHVNAFPLVTTERGPLPADQLFSVAEIHQAYPNGVDPKQMAWMWRRLLIALGHAHDREVIHGAVLPPHILIHPEAHGLLLVDWCCQRPPSRARAVHASRPSAPTTSAGIHQPSWPVERRAPAVDLEMGLRSMVHLLGGDPLTGALPPSVPGPLQAYLHGALATGAAGPAHGGCTRTSPTC